MVIVETGLKPNGEPCSIYIDGFLQKNLDRVKDWVRNKNYDYVAIICGLPGVGKSNFAQSVARYCDTEFTEKNIAFSDDEFITITNNAKEFSAVILDESFQALNTRVSSSSSFLRIVNHLQLIRQKHLFIFLCLPNFFDLSKGIAIYRSSHLFLIYSDDDGKRGNFATFDREAKKQLYIKGMKFMNYSVVEANFVGKFVKQKCIDDNIYEQMKRDHLLRMDMSIAKKTTKESSIAMSHRDNLIRYLIDKEKWTQKKVCDIAGMSIKNLYLIMRENEKQ